MASKELKLETGETPSTRNAGTDESGESMTDREIKLTKALEQCKFIPGSFDKSFAQHMAHIAKQSPEFNISPRQSYCLYRMALRYRRQITDIEIPTLAEIDALKALAEA